MKRNCNLELRLMTPSVSYRQENVKVEDNSMLDVEGDRPNEKQLSIATCDATTKLQARAIIWFASRKMEDESEKQFEPNPLSPLLSSLGYSPTSGLSLKRSLQRFLEKRKSRSHATSPYTIPKPT